MRELDRDRWGMERCAHRERSTLSRRRRGQTDASLSPRVRACHFSSPHLLQSLSRTRSSAVLAYCGDGAGEVCAREAPLQRPRMDDAPNSMRCTRHVHITCATTTHTRREVYSSDTLRASRISWGGVGVDYAAWTSPSTLPSIVSGARVVEERRTVYQSHRRANPRYAPSRVEQQQTTDMSVLRCAAIEAPLHGGAQRGDATVRARRPSSAQTDGARVCRSKASGALASSGSMYVCASDCIAALVPRCSHARWSAPQRSPFRPSAHLRE
jgi:hypothetical protein